MLSLPPSVKIYLATEPTDMRCGIDRLGSTVKQKGLDPFRGDLYVFVSRKRNRVKILTWSAGGFILIYKRLERGRFMMPTVEQGQSTVRLDATQLTMLLDGIDFSRVHRPRHWRPPLQPTIGIDKTLQA